MPPAFYQKSVRLEEGANPCNALDNLYQFLIAGLARQK